MKIKRDTPAGGLNGYFPHKVCINLDRRPERWSRMQKIFAEYGIESVERFAALDGLELNIPPDSPLSQGAYGCLQSHLSVVRRARASNLPAVLIFEDDCCFDSEFNDKFPRYIRQLPPDWDMLLFGGWHLEEPLLISNNILRLRATCLLHAYALNHTLYDAFIELCEPAEEPIDLYAVMLQERFNCYAFSPDLVWQDWSLGLESDIP